MVELDFRDIFETIWSSTSKRQFYVINGETKYAVIDWPPKYAKLFDAASEIEDEDEREDAYFDIETDAIADEELWDLLRNDYKRRNPLMMI